MSGPISNGGRFEIHCSGLIVKSLRELQKQAKVQGRGELVLRAMRVIWHRLASDPLEFGEPLYTLPALRLQVRHGVVGPLLVIFGVHRDKSLVFIKGVTLLPETIE